jgi:hypothetical protein
MSRKAENLLAAEMWWMTGNIWSDAGFGRKAEDFHMWCCLLAWAGVPH